MKAFLCGLSMMVATSAMAQNVDLYVKFNDHTWTRYENISGNIPVETMRQIIARDHPTKTAILDAEVVSVGGNNPFVQPTQLPVAHEQPTAQNQGSSAGKIVGMLVGVVVLGALLRHTGGGAKAFPCVLPTNHARDGSLCGGRASTVRPGGR